MRQRASLTKIVFLAVLVGLVAVPAALAVSTTVVISELRTRGPAGASDEFVEIRNIGATTIDIQGWSMWGSNNSATNSARDTIPATAPVLLGTGCRYLWKNTVAGATSGTGDRTFAIGLTDTGAVAIKDAGGLIVDAAGFSATVASGFVEGTPLPADTTTTTDNRSFERKPLGANTTDTDNNLNDFTFNPGTSGSPSANPQNNTQTCPTAVALRSLTAIRSGKSVLVRWNTGSELDTLGFNVIRVGGGATVKVNRALIASSTSCRGASYKLIDRRARPGAAYTYRLQAVSPRGTKSFLALSRLAG